MKKLKSVIFVYYTLGLGITSAQNATVATGGNATGSGGSTSYSVGQTDFIVATGSGGNANQGIQQPYEIFTSINDLKEIAKNISIFPNPSTDQITINSNRTDFENLNLILFDIQGREIKKIGINKNAINISMLEYPNGIYFLNVYDNNKQVKQFKIIKNK